VENKNFSDLTGFVISREGDGVIAELDIDEVDYCDEDGVFYYNYIFSQGTHNIVIESVDLAGNQGDSSVEFEVEDDGFVWGESDGEKGVSCCSCEDPVVSEKQYASLDDENSS